MYLKQVQRLKVLQQKRKYADEDDEDGLNMDEYYSKIMENLNKNKEEDN